MKAIHILLIAAFAALFYSNSFSNFFVWNDWTLIVENFLIKDWRNLPELFTSSFWKPLLGEPPQIYRPLVLVSFMSDLALWGLNPWGYHLINILLHGLNSILAYFLMGLYISPTTAFIGSVLFASHPIHTGAVAYISGRAELLASFCLLSGIISFLLSETLRPRLLYPVSLVLLFLALFAKETTAIFPLLLVVADLTLNSAKRNGLPALRLGRHIGPVAVVGIYLLFRAVFVGRTSAVDLAAFPDLFHSVLLTLQSSFLYVSLLILPWNLRFHHWEEVERPFLDPQLWLGLLLLLGAAWGLRHALKSGSRAVAFSILWLLVHLLPLLYQAIFVGSFFESWYYLPSLGLFLLAALALNRIQFARVHLWITLLIGVLLGGLIFDQNWEWKNDLRISLYVSSSSSNDPIALRLLGHAYFRRGGVHEAEKAFQRAEALSARDPKLYELRGRLYGFLGRDAEAMASYWRMRDLAPHDPYSYWRIGRFYFEKRNFGEAEKHFSKAARLFPYSSEIHNDLAQVYFRQGKLEEARLEIEAALRISPYSAALRENLGRLTKRVP